jgi:hypothetical protein
MLERIRENCGGMPTILTADSGYISEKNIAYCETAGANAYIALKKTDAESRVMPTTSAQYARFAMQVKLHTPEGRAAYARRKAIVEPVFGQIKGAMGFRCFSLRGLLEAPSEWGFVCTCLQSAQALPSHGKTAGTGVAAPAPARPSAICSPRAH